MIPEVNTWSRFPRLAGASRRYAAALEVWEVDKETDQMRQRTTVEGLPRLIIELHERERPGTAGIAQRSQDLSIPTHAKPKCQYCRCRIALLDALY
jgi:hypothetical protein